MQALAASCEELRARTGNPPLRGCLYDPALPGRDEAEMQNDFDVLK
jgi:hypothetical protein